MEKLIKIVKDFLIPLVTAITGVLVIYLNHTVGQVDQALQVRDQQLKEQIAELDLAVQQSREERAERESNQSFNLRIYEIVTESLEQQNAQQQEVATAFVVVMVDEPLRSSLLNVLRQGGAPEVKRDVGAIIAQESRFKTEEKTTLSVARTEAPGFNWEDWDYDIFWCTDSGPVAEEQAEAVRQQLLSEGANGRIRVRELPDSINAKSGYQISGYSIRRNADEEKQAEALKELAERTLQSAGARFDIGVSSQQTPWYVSLFVCP